MKAKLLFLLLISANICNAQVYTIDSITYLTYNALNFDNDADNLRAPYFRTILGEIHPDLLTVQELIEWSGANKFRDSVMLPVDTNYAMATFISSFDTDRGLFYRKDKFQFLEANAIKTELRDINQFHMAHIASGIEFYVFTLHLKASSGEDAQRAREVDSLRKVTDALPDSIPFIVAGDFNIYDENEPAYMGLLDAAASGYLVDPLQDSLSTIWNNSVNAAFHTQSTRTTSFGGGATGGLDDRFDMILFSQTVADTGKLEYVFGSSYPFGNDGNHYNQAINDVPNTAVSEDMADALHQASDHIPLVAKFVFKYSTDTIPDTVSNAVFSPNIPERLAFYPQPASAFLTLNMPVAGGLVCITDLEGRIVAQPVQTPEGISQLDISHILPGIYVLQAKFANSRQSYLIVVTE